jgi:5'-3' exoribonuclease 1
VLTPSQRAIFDKIKSFVLEHRGALSSSKLRDAHLALPNNFPAGERKFISDLAKDLHLDLAWDEYDENDQNLVTLRFPGALEEPVPVDGEDEDDDEDEWEDDDEAVKAVDRVLKKYDKAKVMNDAEDGNFDVRHERAIMEKMDEWKRSYYKVSNIF